MQLPKSKAPHQVWHYNAPDWIDIRALFSSFPWSSWLAWHKPVSYLPGNNDLTHVGIVTFISNSTQILFTLPVSSLFLRETFQLSLSMDRHFCVKTRILGYLAGRIQLQTFIFNYSRV